MTTPQPRERPRPKDGIGKENCVLKLLSFADRSIKLLPLYSRRAGGAGVNRVRFHVW